MNDLRIPRILSAKWITDLEFRYKPLHRLGLAVGANNLFDVYPDRRPFGKRPDGGNYPQNFQYIPYSASGSPFGFNGRFLYGRVSVDFSRPEKTANVRYGRFSDGGLTD